VGVRKFFAVVQKQPNCGSAGVILVQILFICREKPHDTEWNELNALKLPILSNFSQIQLINEDFYSTIEHCSTIIQSDPSNVKAWFRRAKAHVGAWNPEDAERDFKKAKDLDPSLSKLVTKELLGLEAMKKMKSEEDRRKFQGKLF